MVRAIARNLLLPWKIFRKFFNPELLDVDAEIYH